MKRITVLLVFVVIVLSMPVAAADDTANCCSCEFSAPETLSVTEDLPCDFDQPAGWEALYDRYAKSVVIAKPSCGEVCPASSGITFMVATKPNANADTMEETWRQVMQVVGTASCGGVEVTFFSPPGSDPAGSLGGVKFHIGHEGKKYSANATFSCPGPGGWVELRDLFISTFRTNQDTTFGSE